MVSTYASLHIEEMSKNRMQPFLVVLELQSVDQSTIVGMKRSYILRYQIQLKLLLFV